jgi:hypothetical protein
MTKDDYVIEESKQVRELASKLGVPHAEGLQRDELLRGIGRRSPEVLAALQSHLEIYRAWWQFALELEERKELGRLTPVDSGRYAELAHQRDKSQARLRSIISGFLENQ